MNKNINTEFGFVTPEKQKAFEKVAEFNARYHINEGANTCPDICGVYGRGCLAMNDTANRALCSGCPLADFAQSADILEEARRKEEEARPKPPTFCGETVGLYGWEHGFVDYHTLSRSFDCVMCNDFAPTIGWEHFEQVLGWVDNSEEIAEKREELEAVEERLKALEEVSDKLDSLGDIGDAIEELLSNLDDVENACGEFEDTLRYVEWETPEGETLDEDLESEINAIDFWTIREAIEDFQSRAEREKERLEEEAEDLEEAERLETKKGELTEAIEALEEEEQTARDAEVYQWFIIDSNGFNILKYNAPSELVWYCDALDVYLWGVTHFGTAWGYVLTSIPCEKRPTKAEAIAVEVEVEDTKEAEKELADLEELLDLWWDNPEEMLEEVEEVEEVETTDELTKFRRGAIVRGNASASKSYGYTVEGWLGVVTAPSDGVNHSYVTDSEVVTFSARGEGGEFVGLDPNCFEAVPVSFMGEALTATGANGQPYTLGYSVRAVDSPRLNVPSRFSGVVVSVEKGDPNDEWSWITVTNGVSVYTGYSSDFVGLADLADFEA